jgi:hypothetical protein
MPSDKLNVTMKSKTRAQRKYAIRAVVFQEGEWLCAQCLEYDLVAQAKSLPKLCRALQRLVVGHVAVRLHHGQRPFRDLPRAPARYWTMFRESRLAIPGPMFKLGALKTRGVVVAPPQVRIAVPSAA